MITSKEKKKSEIKRGVRGAAPDANRGNDRKKQNEHTHDFIILSQTFRKIVNATL